MVKSDVDLPSIVTLAREAHAESRFGYIPFSDDKVQKIVLAALEDEKRYGVMLATKGETAVGFLGCSVGEYHIGKGVLIATVHSMYVSRSTRIALSGGRAALGLLKGVETWSEARGAQEVLFHVTSGVGLSRTHKFSNRVGYTFAGGTYSKKL